MNEYVLALAISITTIAACAAVIYLDRKDHNQ